MRNFILVLLLMAVSVSPAHSFTPAPYGGHKFIWIKNNKDAFTESEMQIIANKYDLVVIGNQHARGDKTREHADVKRIKQINPKVPVFVYFPSSLRHQKALYGVDQFRDVWYLRNLTGQYYPGQDEPETLQTIDLSNWEYRQWSLETIRGFLASAPYDGVTFDNANRIASPEDNRYNTVADRIGDAKITAWNNGLANLLSSAASEFNSRNLPVIFNGIARYPSRGERSLDKFEITDGALNEEFCTESNPQHSGYLTPGQIIEDINLQIEFGNRQKIILQNSNQDFTGPLTQQQLNQLGRYCYSIFLMGHVPGYTFFKFGKAYSLDQNPDEHTTNALEIDLPLENPVAKFVNNQYLLSRRFTNGYVLANLSNTAKTWQTPQRLENWNAGKYIRSYDSGVTLNIGPKQGFFLLKPGAGPTLTPVPSHTPAPLASPQPTPTDAGGSDLNHDGRVDIFDYNLLLSGFQTLYDIYDYNNLLSAFGS